MLPVFVDRILRRILPLTFAVLLLFDPRASRAQALTIDQMTRRASVIVEAQVASVHAAWNPAHSQIHTTVRLASVRYHKGTGPAQTLEVRLLGGTVDDMTMRVVDQPAFAPNERVFLFLSPNFDTRDVPFVGQAQGKLRITTNGQGQDILVGPTQTFEKSEVEKSIRAVLKPLGQ